MPDVAFDAAIQHQRRPPKKRSALSLDESAALGELVAAIVNALAEVLSFLV